ncbi:UDP-N-acetylglucosamine 2-epimerase [Sinomonas atrocyanea]|uniref:UDP-N-acetylglucosamine 2-epimerase (non-hydrolyzing) n=1 Tax=Sinomonas atrocyanea TaxID=37927 RepID=A0A126ZWX6_9MICC|nr:UDP-N-acetylglucosamine 2-epimerase (non-hydrolyzing) [Sinomonas atrocyanea]AMM31688.1 UDP-N-acetylglucosamine 2-epimerase [Sinomonas atrocyanea]GEB65322.1 UDP-N-acetyl glucosamine 2-epimerase [Sinomonas atrocyanea]GGG59244.1 UDP-N-acetyl glucosamine 2-epimerase [Sinomonas atrocyanea]
MSHSFPRTPISVTAIYGTRPEAIKMAPLVIALRNDPRFEVRVVVTGQHREMLDQVNQSFGIVPDQDLNIHAAGQTLTEITTRTLQGLAQVFDADRPDAVLVQGDTTTTFAASLAAFYAGVTVVHTEAGLRTGNKYSPYPEEINRRLTGQMASLHLAPTWAARDNLLHENVPSDSIVVTGNSVIDALFITVASRPRIEDPALGARLATGRPVVLVTAHRRESWGEPLRQVGRAIARLAAAHPDHDFVFPAHRNPLVRGAILPAVQHCPSVLVTEPLPYAQFCALLERSSIILTDSGGVQEEGPSLGKPVLVMRDTTERPEAVAVGAVQLVGTDEETIVDAVSILIKDERTYRRMARALNPYGDGHAAERTVRALARHYGHDDTVQEFQDWAAAVPVA